MCEHGRGLDGRTAQAASGTSQAGQMKGRADGQADGLPKSRVAPFRLVFITTNDDISGIGIGIGC